MTLDLTPHRAAAARFAEDERDSGFPYANDAAISCAYLLPELLAEVERLTARLAAAHEALAIDEFDGDSCTTLETTIEYAVNAYRMVCDSEAQSADEITRLRAEVERLRSPEHVPAWLADLILAAARAAENMGCTEPAAHDEGCDACAWEALYQAVPPRMRTAAELAALEGGARS